MMLFVTAMAAAAAAQAPQPSPPAQSHAPMQMEQMSGMDMSKMDHKAMGMKGGDCCKNTADGKMECSMPGMKSGADSAPQGHSGR